MSSLSMATEAPAQASTAASAAGAFGGFPGPPDGRDRRVGVQAGVEADGLAPGGQALDGRGQERRSTSQSSRWCRESRARRIAIGSTPAARSSEPEHQVALGLRHLLAVEADHPAVRVEPARTAGRWRPGLGRTHLVVREDQVGAARLDVEVAAQPVQRDRCALDVPARPAPPSGESQPGSSGRCQSPDQTVQRILLSRSVRVTAPLGEDRRRLGVGEAGQQSEVGAVDRRSRDPGTSGSSTA